MFLITQVSWAMLSDEKLPIELVSDSALCTHKKDSLTCTYSGNAKFNQGATNLQAQQITIYKVGSKINKIVASGKHSSYSIIMDNKQQKINAIADLITVDYVENTMILEKNTQLITDQGKYRGPYIKYKFE